MTGTSTILDASIAGINLSLIGAVALILIMVTMGLTLRVRDFRLLLTAKRAVVAGLLSQLVLLPAIAFLLVILFEPSMPVAIGLILLACCPGGATSNFFTHLAGGDVALSVTLTTVSGVVVIFTLPFLVNLGLVWFADGPQPLQLPVVATMLRIFVMILLPVMVGMAIRKLAPKAAQRIEPLATKLCFATILFTMAVLLHHVWAELEDIVRQTWRITLALNGLMMVIGFTVARALRSGEARSRCIAVETGVQNYLLSVVLALSLLGRPDFVMVPVMYLFTMYVTVFTFIAYCRLVRDRVSAPLSPTSGETL